MSNNLIHIHHKNIDNSGVQNNRSGKHMATAKDVARLAQVSQSTVSRAFSGQSCVLPETKQRIMDAAGVLGYRPNAIARSLISSRTGMIGIVAMQHGSPFYDYLEKQIEAVCYDCGYCTMVIRQTDYEDPGATISRALEYRVDGMIVMAVEDTAKICQICSQAKVPIVLINRYINDMEIDRVCCDNVGAGAMVVEYLVRKGHRKIACLMGNSSATTTRGRMEGIMLKADEYDLDIRQIKYGDYTYEHGREMCRELLESEDEIPDAIFCSGDIIAIGAMDTIRYEFGYRIPEDISIIGFDDIEAASWRAYNLTTVRQPYKKLVDEACRLITWRIDHPLEKNVSSTYPCEIVERGTVKNSFAL